MKILYAVQATGNGHISRAMELLPHLEQYGRVDIFLSGDNSNLLLDAPVKYRSKGLSLYYNCSGGLDYWQIARAFQLPRLKKEIRELPVEQYDLVINDFEYITAAACAKKGIASVNFGHQASFQSPLTPRPVRKNPVGEWVLKNYARASRYIGLHFKRYDTFILPPIIKKEILEATPSNHHHITVYLPSFCELQLKQMLRPFREHRFDIFCRETRQAFREGPLHFFPVEKKAFDKSFMHCAGIITGAGFETPAEALHMGKKLMCIPIRGQYEQQCNAAALREMGIPCLQNPREDFPGYFTRWINGPDPVQMDYRGSAAQCLQQLFVPTEEMIPAGSRPATPPGLLSFLL